MTTESQSASLTKDIFQTVEIDLQTLNKKLYEDFIFCLLMMLKQKYI